MKASTEIKPIQEATSTYFNSIIRRNIDPNRLEKLSSDDIDNVNRQLHLAFPEEADDAVRRLKYLIPYIIQSIDWEEYSLPLEAWQLRYYYRRERFLTKTGLKYTDFINHKPLQKAISDLELELEPTFEFILFLKYYFDLRSNLHFSPIEQITKIREAIETQAEDTYLSLDINIGGKHYKIDNNIFVRDLIKSLPLDKLQHGTYINEFDQGPYRNKIRAIDFFIIKTLLDFLPIKRPTTTQRAFSQAERNFGLSVLNFIGRLSSEDQEGVCSRENNATFDKLMRDFKGVPIPFAMELFL